MEELVKVGPARDRLLTEFGIPITVQTLTSWVKAKKVTGRKIGGRYYVEWESLRAYVHEEDDSDG